MTTSAFSPDRPWWQTAVFYQIYPRSFADGNGDGTGDLVGIRERLDHLVELGVDAIWLSPFYRSPMADGGYDVADPCDVDPLFGTLEDFDALLAAAHERDIKVTVDLVPNHFSDQHPWFQAVLAGGPDAPERDLFIIRPGRGEDGAEAPNNWTSAFGGPAWSRLPDGQWYLHLFAPEQPDLNWENPAVPAEFERIERFWLDRGVDGFRVDVANSMAKEPGLPDLTPEMLATHEGDDPSMRPHADVRFDRDAVHDLHREMRRILDSYPGDRMAVGEAWVAEAERLALYARPDELNLMFNFELVTAHWGAESSAAPIERSLAAMAHVGAACTWVLCNHDVTRPATRYGGGAGRRRPGARGSARAAVVARRGVPLQRRRARAGERATCPTRRCRTRPGSAAGTPSAAATASGCRCRGPATSRRTGSATSPTTWLPMPDDWADVTVAAQAAGRTRR